MYNALRLNIPVIKEFLCGLLSSVCLLGKLNIPNIT
jgi:hypothetical protein